MRWCFIGRMEAGKSALIRALKGQKDLSSLSRTVGSENTTLPFGEIIATEIGGKMQSVWGTYIGDDIMDGICFCVNCADPISIAMTLEDISSIHTELQRFETNRRLLLLTHTDQSGFTNTDIIEALCLEPLENTHQYCMAGLSWNVVFSSVIDDESLAAVASALLEGT